MCIFFFPAFIVAKPPPPVFYVVTTQTGAVYTLQQSDDNTLIRFTDSANPIAGGPVDVILPNYLPVGFECLIEQSGTGQVGLRAALGATINSAITPSPLTGQQYQILTVIVEANIDGVSAQYSIT